MPSTASSSLPPNCSFPAVEVWSGCSGTVSQRRESMAASGSGVVVAILVNRAKEVGVAALDLRGARLYLNQLIETSRGFQNTKNLLHFYSPSDVLVAQGAVGESPLAHLQVAGCRTVVLPRGCFDDARGALLIQKLASRDQGCPKNSLPTHYLALACAAALLKWVERDRDITILNSGLNITFDGSLNHLQVDFESLIDLEVLSPVDVSTSQARTRSTLYSLMNNACLESGAKLLKAFLVQPLKDVQTISTRLDSLEEILSNEALYTGLQNIMKRFPPTLDRNLLHFAFRGKRQLTDLCNQAVCRRTSQLVSGVIMLKESLALFPELAQVLQGTKSAILDAVRQLCLNPVISGLQDRIREVVDEDVLHSRAAFASRAQQCFAVKSGFDGFLDVSRRTFCATTEAVHSLGKEYREQYSLPSLKLPFNARRGFYISISSKEASAKALPKEFSQVVKVGKNIHCTTQQLTSLNIRNKEAAADCYLREEKCLEELCDSIRREIPHLFTLAESMSLLDVLVNCFGSLVASSPPGTYVRPLFTEDGPMAIDAGRHPVLEKDRRNAEYVPNSAFLSPAANLLIITGPNMSGKSTYLQQVAIIAILGHIGCFVPARFASLSVLERIFTRIGTQDSIETNCSTFMTEMKETAYMMANLGPRSLVLVDELGRATSAVDGVCLAWSCCEYLLQSPALSVVATHMHQLEKLGELYPNVKCCSLIVSLENSSLNYKHALKEGTCDVEHYGLALARDMGMPVEVLEEATRVAMQAKAEEMHCFGGSASAYDEIRFDYKIAQRLTGLRHSGLSEEKLCEVLMDLKEGLK